jgi:uncharacterized protein with PIN domain
MIPDASALLAYMLDEPGEERVDRALENATFIDAVNLAEVLSTLVEFGRDPGSVIQALTQARVLGQSSKSLFGKVYAALASRLSISRIIATSMSVSLVCTFRS